MPPGMPHAVSAVPGWHARKQDVPQNSLQQPPLQGCVVLQVVVHACVVVSHE
jgi:hypothetical protein